MSDIIDNICKAFIARPYKTNIWKIETNGSILIPNTYTSIDRLIRFLNYGDSKCKATGIFSKLEQEFNYQKINTLWKYYILNETGRTTSVEILTR